MNPTTCRSCGQTISDPEYGSHICQQCAEQRADAMLENRPGQSDLTLKLATECARRQAHRECRVERAAQIAYWIIMSASVAMIGYWLCKQLWP